MYVVVSWSKGSTSRADTHTQTRSEKRWSANQIPRYDEKTEAKKDVIKHHPTLTTTKEKLLMIQRLRRRRRVSIDQVRGLDRKIRDKRQPKIIELGLLVSLPPKVLYKRLRSERGYVLPDPARNATQPLHSTRFPVNADASTSSEPTKNAPSKICRTTSV